MFAVTTEAARELQHLLEAEGAPPETGVKLSPGNGGALQMTLDAPAEGDEVIREGERPLLILDGSIRQRLDGAVLDVERPEANGQQGVRFVLQAPEGSG
jgi:hypothetical protein